MTLQAWDVYVGGKVVQRVFTTPEVTAPELRKTLVDSVGRPYDLNVVKGA